MNLEQSLTTDVSEVHDSGVLIALFNDCFKTSHQTLLVAGEGEPIYIPANQQQSYHHIEFSYGYFSSALHEIAHWCIAGSERRLETDYGYWYFPDGRNAEQQKAFEKVEIKPQALEWAFSLACNFKFTNSSDNLSSVPKDADWAYWSNLQQQQAQFVINIKHQLLAWIDTTFPQRAKILIDCLSEYYRQSRLITAADVEHSELWKRQCQQD